MRQTASALCGAHGDPVGIVLHPRLHHEGELGQ
jgi:hypothetical protein